MPAATARIVVQATPQEKCTFTAKARHLGMSVSELMRTRAATFNPAPEDLLELAQAAQESIDRSMAAIDAAVAEVAKSNARIKAMETRAGHAATGSRA